MQQQELTEARTVVDEADDMLAGSGDLEGQLDEGCRREVSRAGAIGIRLGLEEVGGGEHAARGIEDATFILWRALPRCHSELQLIGAGLEVERIAGLTTILGRRGAPVETLALIAAEARHGARAGAVGVGILVYVAAVGGAPSLWHSAVDHVGEVEHIGR